MCWGGRKQPPAFGAQARIGDERVVLGKPRAIVEPAGAAAEARLDLIGGLLQRIAESYSVMASSTMCTDTFYPQRRRCRSKDAGADEQRQSWTISISSYGFPSGNVSAAANAAALRPLVGMRDAGVLVRVLAIGSEYPSLAPSTG